MNFAATPPPLPPSETAPTVALSHRDSVTIGRDPRCDVVIDHPLVSWHHARIQRQGVTFEVVDLGSTNGTFVAGQRIRRAPITPGTPLGVATATLLLDQHGALRRVDSSQGITLDIEGLGVDKGRGASRFSLLEKVSLTIRPGELVGIMGPSGAGKTTLLESLNGYDPPTAGRVVLNGRDLYQHYDRFRLDIGYVPQDDILHPQLRVKDALFYTARLRLPPDTRPQEIEARITRILDDLHIQEIADRRIGSPAEKDKVLSGGQRKRVNLAMELLTDPGLLFLDEPTSGLSSADGLAGAQSPATVGRRRSNDSVVDPSAEPRGLPADDPSVDVGQRSRAADARALGLLRPSLPRFDPLLSVR